MAKSLKRTISQPNNLDQLNHFFDEYQRAGAEPIEQKNQVLTNISASFSRAAERPKIFTVY